MNEPWERWEREAAEENDRLRRQCLQRDNPFNMVFEARIPVPAMEGQEFWADELTHFNGRLIGRTHYVALRNSEGRLDWFKLWENRIATYTL